MSKILYIAQFFSLDLEPGGQGQRHFKHAVALAENGHEVTVITGGGTTMSQPTQAQLEGLIPTGLPESLSIIRLPAGAMKKRSVLNRALAYFDFSGKALWTGLKLAYQEKQHFGFVLGSSPPLLVALVAYLLSLVFRAKFYMEVRDLWSQTMSANGFITNRWAIDLNRAVESWLYRQSAQIITLSPAFGPEIETQTPGCDSKTEYIPNGADLEFYQYPQLWNGSYLRTTAEDSARFHINYAGVYSDYTHLETLLEAAALIQNQAENAHFNLVGGGYQLEKLKAYAEQLGLRNITFWDALPKTRISKFLMEGDLSIINYRNLKIFGQVLPNKLYDYMAAGRPVVAAVPEGEVSRIIEASGCGKTLAPENAQALADSILWFYRNQEEGVKMGMQGQQYVLRHFNRKALIDKLLNLFPKVIAMPLPAQGQSQFVGGHAGISSRISGRKNTPTP